VESIAAAIVGLIVAFVSNLIIGLVVALGLGILLLVVTFGIERWRRRSQVVQSPESIRPVGYGSIGFKTRIPGGEAEFVDTEARGPMAVGYDTEAGEVRYEQSKGEITGGLRPSAHPDDERELSTLNQEVVDFWHEYGRPERGTGGTPDTRNHADSARWCGSIWARLDSNQGPTDYESAALTRLSYGPGSDSVTPFESGSRLRTTSRSAEWRREGVPAGAALPHLRRPRGSGHH
jgi:hypothetical protein